MTTPAADAPLLDIVVVDCPDAVQLTRFYGELLGWLAADGADESWATLVPPGGVVSADNPGGRTTLAFQGIEDYVTPTWPGGAHPQQVHLDFSVADLGSAER